MNIVDSLNAHRSIPSHLPYNMTYTVTDINNYNYRMVVKGRVVVVARVVRFIDRPHQKTVPTIPAESPTSVVSLSKDKLIEYVKS